MKTHKNTFIVITNSEQIGLIDSSIESARYKNITFFTTNELYPKLQKRLEPFGFDVVIINKEVRDPIEWFKEWYSTPIKDGKNFKEVITYNGLSLHWLMDLWFYNVPFYFKPIPEVLGIVGSVSKIVKRSPNEVVFIDDGSDFSKLLKNECIERKIKTSYLTLSVKEKASLGVNKFIKRIRSRIKPDIRITAKFCRYLLRWLYWRYIALYYETKKNQNNNKKILMFTTDRWKGTYNVVYKKWMRGNDHFDNLIAGLHNKGYFIKFMDKSESTKIRASAKEKIKRNDFEHSPFESYLSAKIILEAILEGLKFRKKYLKDLNNENFRDSFTYDGVNFYEIMKPKISFMLSRLLIEVLIYLKLGGKMIKNENPDIVVLTGETNPVARSVMWHAQNRKIPVVAIQHGIIYQYIPDFNHAVGDINRHLSCPIPDMMLVYGDFYKKILIEYSKFPKESIITTGASRYDSLAIADKIFEKEKTIEQLDLDKNKKIVVWVTEPEVDKKTIVAVFTAIKKLSEDVQFIIKLHPGEYDLNRYKKVAKQLKINPVIIREIDINELLYTCDLMFTTISTAAIETAILNKPIIILNLSGEKDVSPYVKDGIALGVYKEDNLIINIKKALYDGETQEKLRKARGRFVYRHAYQQDGKATERVVNFIEGMIKESRRK